MSDNFLSRWARRKGAVRAAERSEPPAAADTAGVAEALGTAQPPGEAETPLRTEKADAADHPETVPDDLLASLPSLEALTPDTDLTAFLQAGVPTALRNAALRRMWSLDPAIRDFVSEAREYAYDWNMPGGVPGMGPLLPTDDVKAMLKRVIDGVPVEVEEEPDAEPPEVAAAPQERSADAAVADGREPEAVTRFEEAASPTADPGLQVAGMADVHFEAAESSPLRPRLRRHGGAMPS